MKTTRLIVASLALVSLGAWAATPDEAMTKAGCLACHTKDKKVVGPAYKDVAAKYKGQEVIVYCSHSHRSPRASYFLTTHGFKNVKNVSGGVSTLGTTAPKCLDSYYVKHAH